MPHSTTFRQPGTRVRARGLTVLTIVVLAAALSAGAQAQRQATKRVAAEAQSTTLGKTVLTTIEGRTLYSLSAEKNGRFVCTNSCLSTWRPLRVPAAIKPTGPVKLGTIVRPEEGTQVTYRGRPLYRFAGDTKAGDVNGEGIKDVGTWRAATVPQATAEPVPQPPPAPENPYPY